MKLIDTIKMYYKFYNEILLEVRLPSGGAEGKYHLFNKKEALDFIKGYENEEIFEICLETSYDLRVKTTSGTKPPMLTIYYKNSEEEEDDNN